MMNSEQYYSLLNISIVHYCVCVFLKEIYFAPQGYIYLVKKYCKNCNVVVKYC